MVGHSNFRLNSFTPYITAVIGQLFLVVLWTSCQSHPAHYPDHAWVCGFSDASGSLVFFS